MSNTITIKYFAQMAQERGLNQEERAGGATTALEWFEELNQEFQWSLPAELIRPAVNGQYCSWDSPVPSGATLAFIPPVSGG